MVALDWPDITSYYYSDLRCRIMTEFPGRNWSLASSQTI